MRIAILQSDEVEGALQPQFGKLVDMVQGMLCRSGQGSFDLHVFNVHRGHEPTDLDAFDGYLLTGSRKSVYDDDPWIQRLFDLIRRLHVARTKMVGICFGHQAVAQALGGQVEKSSKGWGIGVQRYECDMTLREGNHSQSALALPCCHQDQVIDMPPGARRVLTNAFCENAGFLINDHILAIQPHPEFSVEYLECIVRTIEDRIDGRAEAALRSLCSSTDHAAMAVLIARFFLGSVSPYASNQ